jgi:hypothetical protein
MTAYVISWNQKLTSSEQTEVEESVYSRTMLYTYKVSKKFATEQFINKHAQSKHGQAGWKLTGKPTILKIDHELYYSLRDYIDDGADDSAPTPTPPNTIPHLRVIK